jgi:hypothetical protein
MELQIYVQNEIGKGIPMDYDYDLIETDDRVSLKYSNSSDWSSEVIGKEAMSIDNDGWGYKIKIGKKTIELNYSQANQLLVLLSYKNIDKIEIRESKIVKSI